MTKYIILILISFITLDLSAQDKANIPGTNLTINLPDGYGLGFDAPILTSEDYEIVFLEMAGLNYAKEKDDFDDLEVKYKEEGIIIEKNITGKLGSYDARFIFVDKEPKLLQIFFGDSSFCAMINVGANERTADLNEEEIMALLSTIEYKKNSDTNEEDEKSPLEEHAHFTLKSDDTKWQVIQYIAGTFGFQNDDNEDAVLITQLPVQSVALSANEDLAMTLVHNFKEKLPNMKVIEEGKQTINNIEGYRVILSNGGEEAMDLLYIFTFTSTKSAFAFQAIGEHNDEATKKQFEDFLQNIELK